MAMITGLNPFHRRAGRGDGSADVLIQALRFRNLLENSRAVYDYLAEAEEKLRGEYIFDRQFVVSLADGVLECLGKIVFDACVLSPSSAEEICIRYDRQKNLARMLLLDGSAAAAAVCPETISEELWEYPEYRLLANALSWIGRDAAERDATALQLLRFAIDRAVMGLSSSREIRRPRHQLQMEAGGTLHSLGMISQGGGVQGSASPRLGLRDLRCRPLGLMLIGGDCRPADEAATRSIGLRYWYAVAGEERLDLWSEKGGADVRLHASLSGQAGSDFIFLYAIPPADPREFVPDDFRIETGEVGSACWSFGKPAAELEDNLIHLGKWLFGTAYV